MTLVVLAALATPSGALSSPAGHGLRRHGGHERHRIHCHFRNCLFPPPGETIFLNNGFPEFYGLQPPFSGVVVPQTPMPAYPAQSPSPTISFPEGMAITIRKTLHENHKGGFAKPSPVIDRPRQAAERLAACWSPPIPERGQTVEVTIRFAFNSRGDVIGSPRITYVKAGKGISVEDVRESIIAALKKCAPLDFSASMAASAPGYPLAVRFIGRRAEEREDKN